MIDRIKELNAQTITLEKKATVQSIRTAYNALSDTEKAQVSNYNLLVQAEATIAQLEAQKNNANTNNPFTSNTSAAQTGTPVYYASNIHAGKDFYLDSLKNNYNLTFSDDFASVMDEIEKGEFKKDEAKMGYVGAFTYAEVISGYTSFFLGARSVCPSVTMEVTFTGSWYDEAAEKEAANKLIKDGCKLISQHADSMGAPTACESAGVPNVSYNGSTISACPNTFIVSSRINWEPYYEYAIKCVAEGKTIDADWTGTLSTGSVELTDVNTKAAAAGTQEAIDAAKKKLEDGSLHVFDTSAFTVNGKKLDSYKADVDTDAKYTPDTEVVKDGYFAESTARSAPYFDVQIDGIKLLDKKQ